MPSTTALRSYWHRRPTPLPTVHMQLFGSMTCHINQTSITPQLWRNRRAYDVLLLLLTSDHTQMSRVSVTNQLWPDMDDKAAANNLRVSLCRLRNILAEATPHSHALITADTQHIAITLPQGSEVDVHTFADTLKRLRHIRDPHYALPLLRSACDLYRGAFLADQPEYEWIYPLREHYAVAFTDLSLRLGNLLLDRRLHPELIDRMWCLLKHDPSNERAHQLLMSSYLATGNHDMVRRVYQSCQASLWHHLGTHPLQQTTAIYTQVSTC